MVESYAMDVAKMHRAFVDSKNHFLSEPPLPEASADGGGEDAGLSEKTTRFIYIP